MKDGLLDRYSAHRRALPLRRTTDTYASRVAEVTLEQTQVARVVPRYEGGGGKVRPLGPRIAFVLELVRAQPAASIYIASALPGMRSRSTP